MGAPMPQPADDLVTCGQNVGKKHDERLKTACFQRFHDKTVRGSIPRSPRGLSTRRTLLLLLCADRRLCQRCEAPTRFLPACGGLTAFRSIARSAGLLYLEGLLWLRPLLMACLPGQPICCRCGTPHGRTNCAARCTACGTVPGSSPNASGSSCAADRCWTCPHVWQSCSW